MMTTSEITGRLEAWRYDARLNCLWGHIYGDIRGRFLDGGFVRTSHVLHKEIGRDLQKGDLVHTRNSIYRLGEHEDNIS